jgi:hypothetical protein
VLIAEGFQNLGRVVADGGQSKTLVAKLLYLTLQLDQLRPAVGSPIRRTEEDQHRALGPHDGLERLDVSGLILQAKGWNLLAHLRSELRDVDFFSLLSGGGLPQRDRQERKRWQYGETAHGIPNHERFRGTKDGRSLEPVKHIGQSLSCKHPIRQVAVALGGGLN